MLLLERDYMPNKSGVRKGAKGGVHTISPPLIAKTTGSDNKIPPHPENLVSPRAWVTPSLSVPLQGL